VKFLSKYLNLIFSGLVIIPTIIAWGTYFWACNKGSIFYLGWNCSDTLMVFLVFSAISLLGSILVMLFNLITKRNSTLLFLGCGLPLISLIYILFIYFALKNASYIL
jgi:hypothetical protein